MISEIKEACEFMIKSCLEICPKRKDKDILIVSLDGFFSQELLCNWGLSNENCIADYWHLLIPILKKNLAKDILM